MKSIIVVVEDGVVREVRLPADLPADTQVLIFDYDTAGLDPSKLFVDEAGRDVLISTVAPVIVD